MEEAENAVREIGTAAMDAVQGLDSATLEGTMPFIVGVLILLIVVKFFALPFKLVWNGIIGAVALWLVNTGVERHYRRCGAVAGKPCGRFVRLWA